MVWLKHFTLCVYIPYHHCSLRYHSCFYAVLLNFEPVNKTYQACTSILFKVIIYYTTLVFILSDYVCFVSLSLAYILSVIFMNSINFSRFCLSIYLFVLFPLMVLPMSLFLCPIYNFTSPSPLSLPLPLPPLNILIYTFIPSSAFLCLC